MWKYFKLIFGALLILASVGGTVSVFNGTPEKVRKRIVEAGTDTMGVIESRVKHTVAARIGRVGGIGAYYTIKYSFTTLDGRKFGDEINVSKEQAYAAKDGQQIRIRYHRDQPSINSPLDFQSYMSADEVGESPIGTILFSAFLMLLGGAWLIWSGWKQMQPASPVRAGINSAMPSRVATLTNRPQGRSGPAVPRSAGKAAFGRR